MLIKLLCNLIGWEHFGIQLENQNFPRPRLCISKYHPEQNDGKFFEKIFENPNLNHYGLNLFEIDQQDFPDKPDSLKYIDLWCSKFTLKHRKKLMVNSEKLYKWETNRQKGWLTECKGISNFARTYERLSINQLTSNLKVTEKRKKNVPAAQRNSAIATSLSRDQFKWKQLFLSL